jgi:hypothetical protein
LSDENLKEKVNKVKRYEGVLGSAGIAPLIL